MVPVNVRLVDGSSFTLELDVGEPVQSLRAQVEQKLKVAPFREVRLLDLAQDGKILCDGDEAVPEVQALQVPSLSRVAEELPAAAEAAREDDGALDPLDDALAAVDDLQPPAQEYHRALEAIVTAARECGRSLDSKNLGVCARLGRLFGRTCADVDTFIDDLVNDKHLVEFSVCALAQLGSRSDAALQPHQPQICSLLDRAMRNLKFLLCTLIESASFADAFVELVAKSGDGAFAARLEEERLPQLRRFADSEEEKLVAVSGLEGALARLRERLAPSA
eukprot:TRINITY_DN17868_c0_g4_i1.p1 TRINITY_DN17868_c0_g4~~TRINITY_DN17868_c0_g4_i1.p1  ORF type:complete len:278 (-),score=74.23 TRINITY_DN17868_c0_g4_i1:164-997(-)